MSLRRYTIVLFSLVCAHVRLQYNLIVIQLEKTPKNYSYFFFKCQHCPLSYHLVLVSSVVHKVSIVLYHIILPWCLLLTKSALSLRTMLTLYTTEDIKTRWYDKGQSWLCQQHWEDTKAWWFLPWCLLLTKSALSFIISSCLGVFCCWQSQHCPLSYHLALVSSVVDKVSTVLYHIIPRHDDMIKDSADFVNNRRHQGRMIW
jgi:hypothetical protein